MSIADLFTNIALGLLAADTVRAILAMLGWVPRETRFWGRLIYGSYDKQLITEGLKELGFTRQQGEEIKKELSSVSERNLNKNGITSENAANHLIALLAKYIVHFDVPIQYGGSSLTESRYYIDTMEMSHNNEDRQKMVYLMYYLYAFANKDEEGKKKPDVVATPKGGNPLFGIKCAQQYSAEFLMIKSAEDKSRIVSVSDPVSNFDVNYEGSWGVKKRGASGIDQKCIVLDCNTSGGSQLIHCVEELTTVANTYKELHLQAPSSVFVLFRADVGKTNIDQKFADHGCKLYRFFDLTEDIKKEIFKLHESAQKGKREPDIYYQDDADQINTIITMMKDSNLFYYIQKEGEN